ncbi:GT2 family glycosyltransferase [Propionicimonas paludicola]|uniref:GT2 family glycosyltransferase n=1 Tax=Propionicimonas paludicola TaxID=185243 RepID=A0A2A9CND9_9ACTN|nr:glycosyltransferase [Propionicimonas paludicola]PFG15666.1 GT2 family glycosyltransferase [Propionicimonas paludicola]
MPRLAVAITTFRRPELLGRLVPAVLTHLDQVGGELIVVDNDPQASGRTAALSSGDPRVHYVVEPSPGIVAARNRALDEAAEFDLLAFIDDDELPRDGWLAHLVETLDRTGATAVSGQVCSLPDGEVPAWVAASGVLAPRHPELRTGDVMARAASGSLLLDLARVREWGLRFDERFGRTGGEDSYFTGQLTQRGGRIVWCAEAIADELVPAARLTREYQLRLAAVRANSTVRVRVALADGWLQRTKLRGYWGLIGLREWLAGLRPAGDLATRARSELRRAAGIGVLRGVFGRSWGHYGD